MKSQIHRTIKAHLLRGAFYLLLLFGRVRDSIRAGAAKRRRREARSRHRLRSEFLATSNAAAAPAIAVSVHSSSPGRTGYHPLRSDEQPCAHATTPNVQWWSSHRRTTSPNSTIMTASLLTISSCQRARFGISLKWMSSANLANLPPRPIRSMFFSTPIAAALPGTLVASRLANPYSGFGEFCNHADQSGHAR